MLCDAQVRRSSQKESQTTELLWRQFGAQPMLLFDFAIAIIGELPMLTETVVTDSATIRTTCAEARLHTTNATVGGDAGEAMINPHCGIIDPTCRGPLGPSKIRAI